MRSGLVAACLVVMGLAGCTVEPPQWQGAGSVQSTPTAAEPGFDAPAPWQRGQWWRYRVTGTDRSQSDTRVVVGDGGSAWMVGTDNDDTAYFEALFDISNIGPVRKADLAGSQQGTPVLYYKWPLAPNATWSTPWDGVERRVHVVGPDLARVAGRVLNATALEAFEGERLAARYDYAAEVGWFSRLEFVEPGGSFRLDLEDFGTGFNGTIAEVQLKTLYSDRAQGPLQPAGDFQVEAGTTFIEFTARFQGETVAYEVTLVPPEGNPRPAVFGPCTANCSLDATERLDPLPGLWRITTAGQVRGGATPALAEVTMLGVVVEHRAAG